MKVGDDPQVPPLERRMQAGERRFHALHVDGVFFSGIKNSVPKMTANGATATMAAAVCSAEAGARCCTSLPPTIAARHGGNVVPEPLLIDEGAALVQPLAVLDQNRAAQRARYRHGIGGEHQREGEVAGAMSRVTQKYPRDGGDIGDDQIAFAAIAEQRHEIGNQAVDRLDDPWQVENGDEGGDLDRRPAVHLFQIIIERLRNQADDLAQAFDDIDQRKKHQQIADWSASSGARWPGATSG